MGDASAGYMLCFPWVMPLPVICAAAHPDVDADHCILIEYQIIRIFPIRSYIWLTHFYFVHGPGNTYYFPASGIWCAKNESSGRDFIEIPSNLMNLYYDKGT